MTRSLLVAVIALGLAAGLGILMVRDPGYLGVAYGGWLFESRLWLGLLGLALLAFVLRTLTLSVAGLLGFSRGSRAGVPAGLRPRPRACFFVVLRLRSGGRSLPRPCRLKPCPRCKLSTRWWRGLGVSPSLMID